MEREQQANLHHNQSVDDRFGMCGSPDVHVAQSQEYEANPNSSITETGDQSGHRPAIFAIIYSLQQLGCIELDSVVPTIPTQRTQ
jgi:hypothetical protein